MKNLNLTPRELQVITLMSEGFSNKRIADVLDISHHTAKFHVHNILCVLDADNRAGAVAKFLRAQSTPMRTNVPMRTDVLTLDNVDVRLTVTL